MEREVWIVSNLPPPVHGVSAFNRSLIDELVEQGIPHRVFRIGTTGSLQQIESFGAAKLAQDVTTLAALGLAGARRTRRDDVVIYFTPAQGGMAVYRDAALARIARHLGIAAVAHIHGCSWLDVWKRGGSIASRMRNALAACEQVICLGPSYARAMREATQLPCVGINNGVHAPSPPPAPSAPEPGARVELLFLSNLLRSKGLWAAAHAARTLSERGLRVRLRCAGAWLSRTDEASFARELAPQLASGVIEMVGFADPPLKDRLLRDAHFFLLPLGHRAEGQPLSLIEAMSYGVLPITTRQGGIPDLLGFPGWQRLANPAHKRADDVAATVEALVRDPAQFEALSSACIEHFHASLTIERCARQIIDVLRRPRVA